MVARLHSLAAWCLPPLEICGRVVLFSAPLVILAVVLIYVRLLFGPISLGFLAEPIERAMNAELHDYSVGIGDAVLHRSERGGIEFRLRDLRITDAGGGQVASAPWAGVEIDLSSLFSLRIAPARVDLIEPRILLVVDDQGRLAMSVESQDAGAGRLSRVPGAGADTDRAQIRRAHGPPVADTSSRATYSGLDIGRMVADGMDEMRRSGDRGATLEAFGLRNATVMIEWDGRQTTWRMPRFSVDLTHKQKRRIVSGSASIASASNPWSLDFRIEASEKAGAITITTEVGGLVPRALAGSVSGVGLLDALDMPIAAAGVLELSMDGVPVGGQLDLNLGAGQITIPGMEAPLLLEQGAVGLKYDGGTRRIELSPSTLLAVGRSLTFAGSAIPDATDAGGWTFDVRSVAEPSASRPADPASPDLEHFSARGRFGGSVRGTAIDHAVVRIGGVEIVGSGRMGGEVRSAMMDFTGRVETTSVSALRALRPSGGAWAMRESLVEGISKGTVTGRHFRLTSPATAAGGVGTGLHLALTLEGQDLEVELANGLPPLELPRILVRIEGTTVEATAPEAFLSLPGARRITFKGNRLTTVSVDGATPLAELVARGQGPLSAFIDLLDREPLSMFKGIGPPVAGMDGKVDTQLRVTLPLAAGATLANARFEARSRITDGRVKNLIGAHDISGATLAIDATERSVDVKGELLLAGVNVKVGGQWQVDPPEGRQTPLKFTTRLDSAYRTQLGLDLEHMISGEVPVEVSLQTGAGEPQMRVVADLTAAELSLGELYWHKPSGRLAKLEFDVTKGLQPKSLELQNFRISGENIAVEGTVGIGPDSKIREYAFPEFSLNIVTNLSARGRLRPDRIWEVVARGKTYQASDLFRSFFTFGGEQKPAGKPRPGIDLDAEIDTVLGANEATLRRVKVRMQERGERLTALELSGVLEGGQPLTVTLRSDANRPRLLQAATPDAGQALKLIGFYTSLLGGAGTLDVNLDGRGAVEKTGQIKIRNFHLLGDPIVAEVLQGADNTRPAIDQDGRGRRRVVREQFEFEHLTASVSVGNGQLALEDVIAKGPLIGASLRGKIDFRSRRMQLGGTYIPLSGINRVLSNVPVFGPLLTGTRGEGVFGITFAVEGPMANPNVIVNPFSLVTIGVLREIFQMAPENPQITPKPEPKARPGAAPQSRSSPPTTSSGTQGRPAPVDPEVIDGWAAKAKETTKRN